MTFVVTVFDTETTGLFYSGLIEEERKPELIEFAGIKLELDSGTRIKDYEFFCKPKRSIPAESTGITGITNEMVAEAKPFAAHVTDIRDALENTDAVIAHNMSYDREMIDTELERCGIKLKWPRLICTVEETICIRGYRLTLTELHKELTGVPFEGAHRAMHDVEALLTCVLKLYERGFI
jgi:DNA polymerase III epsilon subunit-like protein